MVSWFSSVLNQDKTNRTSLPSK